VSDREAGEAEVQPAEGTEQRKNPLLVLGVMLVAALGGAFAIRLLAPAQPSRSRTSRPIVQIVRPQSGLPDLSDMIDRLCPSIANMGAQAGVPNAGAKPTDQPVPAFGVSADGWLVTSAPITGATEAVFGDGRTAELSDLRTDPVSGLSIVRAEGAILQPLPFVDQLFPRVGQFGVALTAPAGNGCSAQSAMIASDFLADGRGLVGYVRAQATGPGWASGSPFVGSDGKVIGIAVVADGTMIPGPLASAIVDELIRNSLSPSTNFGFRVIDFTPPISTRLGSTRSGAGVALVQAKSGAARSGLEAGDIVLSVNDEPVSSASEVNRAVDAIAKSGTMDVIRGDRQLTIAITRS
jgi:serine protease Do